MNDPKIKVRFAPSPTGFLHVGGLRTALFNFLFARKNRGKFILRIEDTDKSREMGGAAEEIQTILKKFGLNWDEGPIFQSQRLKIYQEYARRLVKAGAAYEDATSPQHSPRQGRGVAVRQKIPKEGSTTFEDLVYGKITIENEKLDEGILLKSDGYPVYNLANVIDDHEMGITHIIRGEEFIPSTPKHILLYQAFGWQPPKFAHLPLLLNRERKKLSKRDGDTAVQEYLDRGYLKEAILNFIALLGWNPKSEKEIFSLDELIAEFSLEKVNKAGAVFDIDKLNFINREWQKRLNLGTNEPMYQKTKKLLEEKFGDLSTLSSRPTSPASELAGGRASPPPYQGGEGVGAPGEEIGERSKVNEKLLATIWPLILERVKGPSELEEKLPEFYFFFETPEYDGRLLIWKDTSPEKIKMNLEKIKSLLESYPSPQSSPARLPDGQARGEEMERDIKSFLQREGIAVGEALWPLRVALSGLQNSPGPFEILNVFSKLRSGYKIVNERLEKAIAKLNEK